MTEETPNPEAPVSGGDFDPNDPRIKALVEAEAAKREEGLKRNRDEIKAEKLKLQEDLKRFEGIDPEEVRKRLAEQADAAEQDAKNKGQWQELLDGKEKRWAEERSKLVNGYEEQVSKLTTALHQKMIDSELNDALGAIKVASPLMSAAKAVLRSGVQVVEDVESGGFKVVAKFNGDEVPVSERVKLWADSDEGRYFVEAPMNGGGGANGSGRAGHSGPNPWKTNNITEQMKVIKDNPTKAKALAAEAGRIINV